MDSDRTLVYRVFSIICRVQPHARKSVGKNATEVKLEMRSREPQVSRAPEATDARAVRVQASPLGYHARSHARTLTCFTFFPTDFPASIRETARSLEPYMKLFTYRYTCLESLAKTERRLPPAKCSFLLFCAFDSVLPSEIELEIMLTPPKESHGLYSCPTRLLKCSRHIISAPLVNLINNSVQRGIFRSKLKHAKIIPIFKDGDEAEPGNYRPISLLSVSNRLFEKVM